MTGIFADSEQPIRRICCLGAGFVGGPTCTVIASQAAYVKVTVVDLDQCRINAWKSNTLPVSEPGLLELVHLARDAGPPRIPRSPLSGKKIAVDTARQVLTNRDQRGSVPPHRQQNLFFSTSIESAIEEADLIFIAVETPARGGDIVHGSSPDLSRFNSAVEMVGQHAKQDFIIVTKSTVPCGTAQEVHRLLSKEVHPWIQFEVLSNPEFLAEGTAVHNLLEPDRVLIGSRSSIRGLLAARKLADVYANWVPRDKIVRMSSASCELSKLAANAMLAQRISSMNSLSILCEKVGADVAEVSHACGLDRRLGPYMLQASVGFGGSCFRKDLLHLINAASSRGLDEVAEYWESTINMNEHQKSRFVSSIKSRVPNASGDRTIAVLGFAFKAETNDTRDSAAALVVRELLNAGYHVRIYDPEVEEGHIWLELRRDHLSFNRNRSQAVVCSTPYEACDGAHAVAITTEWKEFFYTPSIAGFTPPHDGMTAGQDLDITIEHQVTKPRLQDIGITIEHQVTKTIRDFPVVLGNGPPSFEAAGIWHDTTAKRIDYSIQHIESRREMQTWLGEGKDGDLKASKAGGRSRVRWEHVAQLMQEPRYIFDGRNVVDPCIQALGFKLEAIGKPRQAERVC
ncbi:UDP-glucose 6-dehydrogenase 1 [Lambiella insularis]|nr:UDP-glucose 6-dehydrogenase 1 [Lambiella insularis]